VLRDKKIETVKRLKELFCSHDSVFLAHYHGLNVAQITELRSKMYEGKIVFFITKNNLTKIGVKDSEFGDLTDSLTGPLAIAISNDPVSTAKILVDFANENEQLKLIGAKAFGERINYEGIQSLSKMPSLDELRAKLIALIQTPARSIASILVAPATTLTRVFSEYSNKSKQ